MADVDFSAFDDHPSLKKSVDFSAFDNHIATRPEDQKPDELQSAAEGLATGYTAGLKPILAGTAKSILDTATGISNPMDIVERYRMYRDAEKKKQEDARAANPKSFVGAEMGGGAIASLLTGGGAAAAGSYAPILNDGTALQRYLSATSPEMINMIKTGGELGATTGFANSGGDLTKGEVLPVLKDTVMGGLGGMATGLATGKIAENFHPQDSVNSFANMRAVNATGIGKSDLKKMITQGRVDQHGENLLAENPFGDDALTQTMYGKTPLITPFASGENILDRATELEPQAGKVVGDVLFTLDRSAEHNPELQSLFFNPATALEKLKLLQSKLIAGTNEEGEAVPYELAEQSFNKLQKAINTVKSFGDEPIPFEAAGKLKKLVSDAAYGENGTPDPVMSQVRGIVNDEIEDAADNATKELGQTDLYKKYLQAKDFYRTAKDANKASLGKTASEMVNRDLGITDYMAAVAGAAAHGTPGGIIAGATNKVAKTWGNPLLATGAKAVANKMKFVNDNLIKAAPEKLQSWGYSLINSGDTTKGRLGVALIDASQRDNTGRNAVMFSLSQNPSYRKLLSDLNLGEEQPVEDNQ